MKYILSNETNQKFVLDKEYWSFKNLDKFLEYFLASYDQRFKDMDYTFNIYDIQDLNIPPPNKNELNVMVCMENCLFHKHYKHYNEYGDYGDKNIQIYIYNHIDKVVKTDTYIAIPLLWFRFAYLERYYDTMKPPVIRKKTQQKHGILMTDNHLNKDVKHMLFLTLSKVGQTFTMKQFKSQMYYESIWLTDRFLDFINVFRFAIVCENSEAPGYITEKLLQCYHARVVPIYWGNEPEKYFEEGSFINAKNYNVKQLYEKLIELNKNDKAYEQMVNHKKLKNPGVDYFAELVDFVKQWFETN